jgi:ABC-type phosphate/phosphonate transport system permease subunit
MGITKLQAGFGIFYLKIDVVAITSTHNLYFSEIWALDFATRSAQPTGPGKMVLVVLTAMLGLMLGTIFALVTEFIVNVCHK